MGVRSTRVRTFHNSQVYVPNGKLADMVVDNYGLRQIVERHPNTRKDFYHIYLNDLGAHSIDILFYIFFAVPTCPEELRARHEVLMVVIDLARKLGVEFAFPMQTLHVETFPEKAGNTPTYDTSPNSTQKRMDDFFKQYEQKISGNGKQN